MVGINGATLFGLKDFLTLYASGGYTRSWSEGLNYSHMYDEFYYSVMAQMQYKDFSLLGQFRKVQNNFLRRNHQEERKPDGIHGNVHPA